MSYRPAKSRGSVIFRIAILPIDVGVTGGVIFEEAEALICKVVLGAWALRHLIKYYCYGVSTLYSEFVAILATKTYANEMAFIVAKCINLIQANQNLLQSSCFYSINAKRRGREKLYVFVKSWTFSRRIWWLCMIVNYLHLS